jgi:hypothetical protein
LTDAPLPSEPQPAPAEIDPEPGPEPGPESEPLSTGSVAPAAAPVAGPAVESTRRLIGASFELLTRASDDMRRASFYIGILIIGTVGPLALASWAVEVVSIHRTQRQMSSLLASGLTGWLGVLGIVAGAGLFVAAIESRTMAAAILGGHVIGRPVTVQQALARSRMAFWRVVVGSIIVGVPVLIAQGALNLLSVALVTERTDTSVITSVLAAAVVGGPLTYVLSGIVLGDVDPFEATRRSFRVFTARKVAGAVVAVFETLATVLVLLGLSAGLDVALRVFGALGLGPESGPVGLTLMTMAILVAVFALGTLVYTAYAIAVAPQIVMFVGLTHATFGLDHVRPGGDRDPAVRQPGRRRFRWLTIPFLLAFLAGVAGLAAIAVLLAR